MIYRYSVSNITSSLNLFLNRIHHKLVNRFTHNWFNNYKKNPEYSNLNKEFERVPLNSEKINEKRWTVSSILAAKFIAISKSKNFDY